MASKKKVEMCRKVIAWLADRYPGTFGLEGEAIRPLKHGIVADIASRVALSDEDVGRLRSALDYYMSRPAYLRAVALGRRRRDLLGNKVESCGVAARLAARTELERRGLWTENLENLFRRATPRRRHADT